MTTALVLEIPEAEPVVASLRARHYPSAAAGMPAHVTLIYPFLPFEQIDALTERRLAQIFSDAPRIVAQFSTLRRFPGTLWLAPDDPAPVIALTEALARAFPDNPPYGGVFSEIVPHLTLADFGHNETQDPLIDRIERQFIAEAAPLLPIRSAIRAASLFRSDQGRWQRAALFALAS